MRKKIYSLFALLLLTASAFAQLGVNVTDSLSDPTMEGVANWSNVGFKDNHKNTAYPLFNGYFIEAWTKSAADAETYLGSVSLTDTLRNLPNGSYLFSTAVMACQQSGNLEFVSDAFMFANDETVAVSTANNVPERFYVMTTVTDGQLVVGYRTVETDANWIAVDNARLYYYKDAVDKDCAISYLTLQDAYEQAVVYPDTLPMQQTVLTALKETVASAATLLSEGTAGKDVIDAAVEAIEAAVAAADASRASYDNLNKAIADALAVVEEYAEVPEVIDELDALQSAIDIATKAFADMTADDAAVADIVTTLQNKSAVLSVAVLFYDVADVLSEILNNCVAGTSYGMYPQSQMDKMAELQATLDEAYASYEQGDIEATEVLNLLEEAQAAIEHFYETMVIYDFSQALNFSMWPYDATDDVAVMDHDNYFSTMAADCPWTFGARHNYTNTFTLWNPADNSFAQPATEKASADCYGWSDAYASGWFFIQSDGVFQPRGNATNSDSPALFFTAPASAIYYFKTVVSSNDSKRTNGAYDPDNSQLGAYFIQKGDSVPHIIGETVGYYYGTPATKNFYVNLNEGDMVLLSLGETVSDGHGGAQVDTLFVLGAKDEEHGYTMDDVLASGYTFYNAYVVAENWADLEAAIEAANEALTDAADNKGDGLGQKPESAFAALEALIQDGQRMIATAVASQPDVDLMTSKITKGIDAFTLAFNSGICIAYEEAPSDSTLFANHKYLPDGLYYIVDNATGFYLTAPANGDKVDVYFAEAIDPTYTEQNCQVWHLNYMDTLSCYGIGSHANLDSGSIWTLEQELAAGDDASDNGFYHISEKNARQGTSWFVVNHYDEALWRGQRVYTNGQDYSIIAGRNQDFNTVWSVDGNNKLIFTAGAARTFCFSLLPFGTVDAIQPTAADRQPVEVTIYNMQGMTSPDAQGIVIVRTQWSDGTVTTAKQIRR